MSQTGWKVPQFQQPVSRPESIINLTLLQVVAVARMSLSEADNSLVCTRHTWNRRGRRWYSSDNRIREIKEKRQHMKRYKTSWRMECWLPCVLVHFIITFKGLWTSPEAFISQLRQTHGCLWLLKHKHCLGLRSHICCGNDVSPKKQN